MIKNQIDNLIDYCRRENFKGYDPYDILNSAINFRLFGNWIPPVVIQIQKRNPINIRSLVGVKKGYNPKGMGLFLKVFCLLYKQTGIEEYLEDASWFFNWLRYNYTRGFSGYAWGYNFDWASPGSYLKAYTPSVVVTSFIIDGIFEYYKLTDDKSAKDIIISAANYISKDIIVSNFKEGIAFSYTHLERDCCYNASLLAAEVLAKADYVESTDNRQDQINKAIDFVLYKQHISGEWWYSMDLVTNKERKQIDFHQGFILVSLDNLGRLLKISRTDINDSIDIGLRFYRDNQFYENGKSLWRVPKKWPTDIHNQSQGIITFSRLKSYDPHYLDFANRIAGWTIKNMQSQYGNFYYRKTPLYINKISYMRWSQAWMSLALSELLTNEEE